jgi:hypothetical protein
MRRPKKGRRSSGAIAARGAAEKVTQNLGGVSPIHMASIVRSTQPSDSYFFALSGETPLSPGGKTESAARVRRIRARPHHQHRQHQGDEAHQKGAQQLLRRRKQQERKSRRAGPTDAPRRS